MQLRKLFGLFLILISLEGFAQDPPPATNPPAAGAAAAAPDEESSSPQKPNGKRIRRQINLVVGLSHDEEFLIPKGETTFKGRTAFLDIQRIEGTDFFRIFPKQVGSGIVTLHNKKTGQILVEIRFDIRDDSVERTLREIQSLLTDIDGIEYKLINPAGGNPPPPPTIVLDGFVLLPRDLIRIFQVIANYSPERVRSLVTLSPISRQRIAEFITADVNNPEVKISAVGNFIKLEGQVNNEAEKTRIKNIVSLYLPDIVIEKAPTDSGSVQIIGRKTQGSVEDLIVDLITVRPQEEKVDPPPKLIQIVAHFVKFNDSYSKNFNFSFAPALSAQNGTQQPPSTGFGETINLLNNLLPKIQWAKFHGFAKVLDTASILIQDKKPGTITRNIGTATSQITDGIVVQTPVRAGVTLTVTPVIKSERSGLVELNNLVVKVSSGGKSEPESTTEVSTTISVRDRQSAAFGGILKKNTDTAYGAPTNERAVITFNASKEYNRSNSQFVVFVTPIIKSSASTGVEQVKKKFRLRD